MDLFCQKVVLLVGFFNSGILQVEGVSHMYKTNFETNSPPPIINVVCKFLKQFFDTSFGVATLPRCCNITNLDTHCM